MRPRGPEPGSPLDWLRHARSDLALAEARKSHAVLYEHLCFHAQQAAEKAIKALLVSQGIRILRTHDLAYLMDQLPPDSRIPVSLIDLPRLTKYAVQQRYPGEVAPLTFKDRRRALLLAREAVEWVSTKLARPS